MKTIKFIFVLCFIVSCSKEQAASAVSTPAKSYNESNRDNIIKNWQAKVSTTPGCSTFKEQFQVVGSKFDNAANASFFLEMGKVWDAAKAAKCASAP